MRGGNVKPGAHVIVKVTDETTRTGVCAMCGPNSPIYRAGHRKSGPRKGEQQWACSILERERVNARLESGSPVRSLKWARRRRARTIALQMMANWVEQVTVADIRRTAPGLDEGAVAQVATELGWQARRMRERAADLNRTGPRPITGPPLARGKTICSTCGQPGHNRRRHAA